LVDAAGRGGTLLLHVPEADVRFLSHQSKASGVPEFDGIVLLGDTSTPACESLGVNILARVEAEASSSPASRGHDSRATLTSGLYRPGGTPAIVAGDGARKRPRTRFQKLMGGVRKHGVAGAGGVAAVWLVAVLAVWLVWQGLSGWPAFEDDFDAPVESSETLGVPGEGDREPAALDSSESTGDDPGAEPGENQQAPADSGVEPGVDLPYSVLIASHVAYEDAAAERDRLNESGSLLAFVAPTPIRERLYFRVFAGALEDRMQAAELMRRLVEEGSKERERDWDMRPVDLAFAIRDFASEEEAGEERQRLHDAGLPAYVLAVGDTTGAIYRLYSGAFESEGAAGPTDALLSAAGQSATLVTRRGEPR
ncbi:MAG: SPOR domain-containing protein, partial [Gemmatimonadetes bacterium]|nr:SPOR domain-containing protein [Gemmatimonadota bacterium]